MLAGYFRLCQLDDFARKLYYHQIPEWYIFDAKEGVWNRREGGRHSGTTIGRMMNIDFRRPERFHLRLLLLNVKGARCYDDLKRFNGVLYPTFTATCVARGLARDDREWHDALQDASYWRFPRQLRQLFAMILALNHPKDPGYLWDSFRDALSYDYRFHCNYNQERAYAAALSDIAADLREHGTSLAAFPSMPRIEATQDEETIDQAAELAIGEAMCRLLTAEQRAVVDYVMHRIRDPVLRQQGCAAYVNGPGGSGKTFVYRCLYHLIRAAGLQITMAASTGCAATLLPGGSTVHSACKLPVPLESNSEAKPTGHVLRRLKRISAFVWDEAPMSPKYALEAVDRMLRRERQSDRPFGGVFMLLGGDFRQCLPIDESMRSTELLDLSIRRSDLWSTFQVFDLTENLRARTDQSGFAEWVLSVGDGLNFNGFVGYERLPRRILSTGNLIEEVYGDMLQADAPLDEPSYIEFVSKRSILATLNDVCLSYNDAILARLPGDVLEYTSIDLLVANSNTDQVRVPTEFLNTVDVPTLPPYKLRLKCRAVVMLLINLRVSGGLTNGTRLVVLKQTRNVLLTRILNGSHKGQLAEIPRISVTVKGSRLPFTFTRHQFPVRLSWAASINKSQGATFDFVGLDLRREVFGHGQLYVGLSRVRTWDSLRVLLPTTRELRRT